MIIERIYQQGTRLLTAALILISMGCAHSSAVSSSTEQKIATEPEVVNYDQLRAESERIVSQDKTLTADQKSKLIDLKVDTTTKLDSIQKEMLTLKAVLLKNIVAEKYNAREVLSIESRLSALSDQKMKTFFEALDKGRKLLSKAPAREQILNELRLERNLRLPFDRF